MYARALEVAVVEALWSIDTCRQGGFNISEGLRVRFVLGASTGYTTRGLCCRGTSSLPAD